MQDESEFGDHHDAGVVQDRWATIRENAHKRAARQREEAPDRASEDQSTQRTDDGETSGEESECIPFIVCESWLIAPQLSSLELPESKLVWPNLPATSRPTAETYIVSTFPKPKPYTTPTVAFSTIRDCPFETREKEKERT